MAKLKSLIKIEGTLDDLTFYKGKEGYLVRRKGGVNRDRINNDPAFIRTRENGTEFGHSATAGKILRRAIVPLLSSAKDNTIVARLVKLMTLVKNEDTTSVRGQRKVHIGLTTDEGKAYFKGFDFNSKATLSSVLLTEFALDTATGEIAIPGVIPNQNVVAPPGATHVSFTSGFLNLDFETAESELILSPKVNTPINGTSTDVTLTPVSVPQGTGNQFYFLQLEFFQEINSVQYQLNNGTYNVLTIIEIL